MPRIHFCLPAVLLTIAAAGTANAAEPVIVFDDSKIDAISEPFADELAERLGISTDTVSAAVPASAFAFDSATLWPSTGEAAACVQGEAKLDLAKVVAAGQEAIDSVDYAGAVLVLSVIEDKLACLAPPVDGPALARASYLLGYANYQAGNVEAASSAFAQAAAFDSEVDWDDNFAPDGQQTFNRAVLEALRAAPAEVRFSIPDGPGVIEVDGAGVSPGAAITGGQHHLRVPTPGGGLTSMAVRVTAGEAVELVPVQAVTGRWFGPPADARESVGMLAAPLAVTGADELYVIDPASKRIILVRPADGQVLEVADAPLARRGLNGGASRQRVSPGVVMAIAGGVAAGAGLVGGLAERGNAMSILDDAVANPDQREQLRADYGATGDRMTAAFVIAGTGAAVLAVGIPLGVHQGRQSSATDASVSLWWSSTNGSTTAGGFRLSGQW